MLDYDYDADGNSTPLIIYPKEESIEQEKFHVDPSKTERIYGAAPILPTRAENGWTSSYLNEIFSQDAPTDMTEVRFLDINDDGQPELWLDYGYGYAGGEVFTTDGSTTDKVYLSHGAAYTIPGSNLLHTTGGHMGGYYDEIYKIENGKFTTVAKGSYGETEDQQTDENGELIYRYYWNGEDVSEEQYEQNLKELFDQDQAEDIYQNIYTFEQSKALLQQMMIKIMSETRIVLQKKQLKTVKKLLHLQGLFIIIASVVTLIALKREVAADSNRRFSVERMSSYKTGDKSLYNIENVRVSRKHRVRFETHTA